MKMYKVIGYPTLDRKKTMLCLGRGKFEANIRVEWNGRGLSITNISYSLIEFLVRIIAQKFYHSSRLNSVSSMVVDQA